MEPKHLTMAELLERRKTLTEFLRHTNHATKDQRALGTWRLGQIEQEIRRRGGRRSNPAWLNEALTVSWEELEERVPPVVKLLENGRVTAKPYGCGEWGCVLPTAQPGVVVKITNDVTEARFVNTVLRDDSLQMPGIVRYYDLARLPPRYQGRAVYAIWREEAFDVGTALPERGKRTQAQQQFREQLGQFHHFSSDLEDTLKRAGSRRWRLLEEAYDLSDMVLEKDMVNAYPGGRVTYKQIAKPLDLKVAVELQVCRVFAEIIAHGALGQLVGRSLADLMSEGILLPDVHLGNVGNVVRAGRKVLCITDPGRAMPLYQRLAKVMEKAA